MDFANYKYISNDEYNKFIDLFYNGESYYMKANSKKDLKKYVRENKLNTKTRALYMYLYFTRKDFNRINDKPPDEEVEDKTNEEEVVEAVKEEVKKVKKPLVEQARGKIKMFNYHIEQNKRQFILSYPDEWDIILDNKYNDKKDDELTSDEKVFIGKIIDYKIYTSKKDNA